MNSCVCGNDRMYFATFGIPPGQGTKLRHEVRIRQEAHVKHQVRILGHTMPEAETHAGNQDVFARRFFWKRCVM